MTEVAYFISSPPDVAHTGDGRRKGKTPKEKERAARSWACSEELYDCHRQMGSYWEFGFEFIELAVVPAFCTLRTDRLQTFV